MIKHKGKSRGKKILFYYPDSIFIYQELLVGFAGDTFPSKQWIFTFQNIDVIHCSVYLEWNKTW